MEAGIHAEVPLNLFTLDVGTSCLDSIHKEMNSRPQISLYSTVSSDQSLLVWHTLIPLLQPLSLSILIPFRVGSHLPSHFLELQPLLYTLEISTDKLFSEEDFFFLKYLSHVLTSSLNRLWLL